MGMFLALHRNYLRTCDVCGYRWAVNRAVAGDAGRQSVVAGRRKGTTRSQNKLDLQSSAPVTRDPAGDGGVQSAMEALRTCAKCGVQEFTQRGLSKGEEV